MAAPDLIGDDPLTLCRIRGLQDDRGNLMLSAEAQSRIAASRAVVERLAAGNRSYYGINTGFGILAHQRISPEDVDKLQENLILSHAVGVGREVDPAIVQLMLLLKINALALGLSGVRPVLVEYLLSFYNANISPVVFAKGSLGASGDLAPLAHLTLPLLGLGEVWMPDGSKQPATAALDHLGLVPLRLKAKEGLALINGTQFMAAHAVHTLLRMQGLLKVADITAAMTLEAMRGSATPFDERIHAARPHAGQIESAGNVRQLLVASEILPSHLNCGKVQDPYSIRCVPQVHGAVRDTVRAALATVETELNSVTDNPLVFPNGDVVSGGNFHGEPLAFAMDFLAIAAAEIASISERRIYLLLGGDTMGEVKLPKLLMSDTGLNSGFMLPQYTAAALVSENKILAHPASVDSIPSSLGQEDHVSMGSISATKLLEVVENVETVLAIEVMCAAQALDFIHPLKAGRGVEAAHAEVRRHLAFAEADRLFHQDIQTALALVKSGSLVTAAEEASGKLQ
ncbi:MAG: histidine ammonia-lyase [Cephaloticoccus sp.]|nr:histidine ammonia-lyase [Cephaloticoccus sp.]MCF7759525.1 histidine ammonia-lyase [Cephaloticoccus sp.]